MRQDGRKGLKRDEQRDLSWGAQRVMQRDLLLVVQKVVRKVMQKAMQKDFWKVKNLSFLN